MSFYLVSFFTGKRRCFLLFRNKTQFAGLVTQFNVSMLLSFSIFRMKRGPTCKLVYRVLHYIKTSGLISYLAIPVSDIKGLMILKNVLSCFKVQAALPLCPNKPSVFTKFRV